MEWIAHIFTKIWSEIFNVHVGTGTLDFSFGTLLLGTFILSIVANFIGQFVGGKMSGSSNKPSKSAKSSDGGDE